MNNQDLILRIKNRDNQACSVLYEIIERKVKYYCLQYDLENNYIPDLVQDTIYRCLQTIDNFRGDCPVENWAYFIAISICKNYIYQKKTQKRNAVELYLSQIQDIQEIVADKDVLNPLENMIEKERRDLLAKALLLLTYEQKIAYELKVEKQLPYNQIAQIMGKTIDAVKKLIQRAKAKIIKYMKKYN
jgi:RNA polymerase sigma-70 factor (ECF subfamily)